MASSFAVSRSQIIYGLCLPLAVLIGYFLAEPLNLGTMALVSFLLLILALPLLMRWYHPLLVVGWNAWVTAFFLPGRPSLWMVLSFIGLLIALLNRSVNAQRRFINIPSLTKPIFFLAVVVLGTAVMTGGIGLAVLGSSTGGGKAYVYIFAAMAGYFALTSQRIPVERARLLVALFFLSGLTSAAGMVIARLGSGAYFLLDVFPADFETNELMVSGFSPLIRRLSGFTAASTGLYAFVLALFGVRGLVDLRRPWRLLLFLMAIAGCLWCGYRGIVLLFLFSFAAIFYLEGLCRTKWMAGLVGLCLLVAASVFPWTDHLPLAVQRSLSFLPGDLVKLNYMVRQSADSSTEWRLQMWRAVWPQVGFYLFKGKGFQITADDVFWAQQGAAGFNPTASGAAQAGDYHSGPLSLLIPFGIWGAIGFTWLLIAAGRYLYHNYRYGDPTLQQINTVLLGIFVARVVFFLGIFGSFYSDLYLFTGILGLSVSLNGAPKAEVAEETQEEVLNRFTLRV